MRLHCLVLGATEGTVFHLAPRLAHLLKINTAIPPAPFAPTTTTELRNVIPIPLHILPKTKMYTKRRQAMSQKKQKQA